MFNRAQPSDQEIEIALVLVSAAKRAIVDQRQTVLYEASRDRVTINAYGFMDAASQEAVVSQLRAPTTSKFEKTKIKVFFFPPREYSIEKMSDGREVTVLKKVDAIRKLDLN